MTLLLLQIEGEGPLAQSQNQQLHWQLLQRQREALLRSQPEAVEVAAAAKKAASTQLSKFEEQPDWIQQGQLYPHQLAVSTGHPACHMPSCCATLCCGVPCHPVLGYTSLCWAMLDNAVLCYAMLYCAMLCYAVLCLLCSTVCFAVLLRHGFSSLHCIRAKSLVAFQ